MNPVGPRKPLAILVGEVPSHDDYREMEPVCSASPTGREFDEMLMAAGLERDRLFFVNVIACVPTEPRRTKDLKKAVKCCRPLLKQHLAELPPETPTLVMGALAMLALDGKPGAPSKTRGFINYEWKVTDGCKG